MLDSTSEAKAEHSNLTMQSKCKLAPVDLYCVCLTLFDFLYISLHPFPQVTDNNKILNRLRVSYLFVMTFVLLNDFTVCSFGGHVDNTDDVKINTTSTLKLIVYLIRRSIYNGNLNGKNTTVCILYCTAFAMVLSEFPPGKFLPANSHPSNSHPVVSSLYWHLPQ